MAQNAKYWITEKILKPCYFVWFGHAWPCPTRLTVSTCRKVWSLSACNKNQLHPSLLFYRYCKNITNYFQYFGHDRIIEADRINIICHLKEIHANINDLILIKAQNTSFWTITGHFGPNYDPTLTQNAKFWNIAKILKICYFVWFGHA